MEATGEYRSLSTEDGKSPDHGKFWTMYPGERRSTHHDALDQSCGGPPKNSILIKTGGNALQAIDQRFCDQKDVMSVVVPECVDPGQIMLVKVPDGNGRMVSVKVQEESCPGHIILVRVPRAQPFLVAGVPVEVNGDAATSSSVVAGHDIESSVAVESDLLLKEESSHEQEHDFEIVSHQEEEEEEFEMVPNKKYLV
jgi:hypothetical protein